MSRSRSEHFREIEIETSQLAQGLFRPSPTSVPNFISFCQTIHRKGEFKFDITNLILPFFYIYSASTDE